jgi:uncharacterized membrane protein HdeD (DUF308 family)
MTHLMRNFQRRADAQIAMTDDHWRLFSLQGAGLALFGITAAVLPNVTSLEIGPLVGWPLLIAGLFRLAAGFDTRVGPGHWSSMLLSALMVPFGAATAFYPMDDAIALTLALSGYLLVHGIAGLILAMSLRDEADPWWAILLASLIDFALAVMIFAGWPSTAPWVFGSFVGINLLAAGLALIVVGIGTMRQMHAANTSPR